MTDGPDIGGRSRRFQAAVIVVTMLALLAGALAAASLSNGGSLINIDPGNGDGGSTDGGAGDIGSGGDGGGGGGAGGDGVDIGGGGLDLPEFLVDVLRWFTDGNGSSGGNPEPVDPGENGVPPPPYDITLEPEPTPGAQVVVTVEKNGTPVPFVVVAFDGEPVGRTGRAGQLGAQVPYTDEVTVTAIPPSEIRRRTLSVTGGGQLGQATAGLLAAPAASGQADDRPANTSVTYDVRTNVSARVDGVALPGETTAVRFTVADNPLRAVSVSHDGERMGVTNSNGAVDITVPAETQPGGSVELLLERDEFTGETAIEVGEVTASVETGLLALPATGVTVEVRAVDSNGTEPLDGVPVTVTDGGERVVSDLTGENGTMSFTLPWTGSVTATATTDHGPVSATVTGVFLQLAGLVMALALPVAGLAVWARQNPATRREAREQAVGVLLTAGGLLESVARRFVAVVRRIPVTRVAEVVREGPVRLALWLRNGLVAVAGRLRAGLVDTARRLRSGDWLALFLAGPRWFLGRLRAGLLWLVRRLSDPFGDESDEDSGSRQEQSTPRTQTGSATVQEPQSAYSRLRRYWRWLVRRVVGRGGASTKTPAEIERRAVERGLPADAARRLRQAFQEVEYGPADAEERVEEAESAHETLRGEDKQ